LNGLDDSTRRIYGFRQKSFVLEQQLKRFENVGLVIGNENSRRFHARLLAH
jgi:hypothetical protein